MNFKLAIFDLDGTLLNTSPGIFASANATVEKLGLPPEKDPEQLKKFIGPPIKQCFVNVYDLDPALIDKAVEIYRGEYDSYGRINAQPYPGIAQTLSKLKENGFLLAVGTLKGESLAKQMLEYFQLSEYFKSIRGSDQHSTLSKADIVNNVLSDLKIDAKDAVLIGDTIHDQEGAKQAGVSFIAVDWGFGFPKGHQKNESTFAVAQNTDQLISILS